MHGDPEITPRTPTRLRWLALGLAVTASSATSAVLVLLFARPVEDQMLSTLTTERAFTTLMALAVLSLSAVGASMVRGVLHPRRRVGLTSLAALVLGIAAMFGQVGVFLRMMQIYQSMIVDGRRWRSGGLSSTAGAMPGTGWGSPAQRPLDPDLAESWTAAALAEHASVAAFAELSIALMHHAAPAALVARCHAAALDEVRHAEARFAVASAYAGRPITPGPLPVTLRPIPDLPGLAVESVVDGCWTEGLAAVRAAEQAHRSTHPGDADVLAAIAHDETAHAELAWDIVAFCVARGGEPVQSALRSVQLPASEDSVLLRQRVLARLDAQLAQREAA
jgi:hypothetical protein